MKNETSSSCKTPREPRTGSLVGEGKRAEIFGDGIWCSFSFRASTPLESGRSEAPQDPKNFLPRWYQAHYRLVQHSTAFSGCSICKSSLIPVSVLIRFKSLALAIPSSSPSKGTGFTLKSRNRPIKDVHELDLGELAAATVACAARPDSLGFWCFNFTLLAIRYDSNVHSKHSSFVQHGKYIVLLFRVLFVIIFVYLDLVEDCELEWGETIFASVSV